MRVARVLRRRHVRGRIADQPFVAEPAGHQFLNVVFGGRDAAGEPLSDLLERLIFDSVAASRTPARCVSIAASSQTAANRCTRSPEETTSTPACRMSSTVPASTREMYGIAQLGEYSIATRRSPETSVRRPSTSCSRPAYRSVVPGRCASVCRSMEWTRPRGSPTGGNQVVPAPAGEMTLLTGDRGQLGGDRVQSAKVVEQPAVDAVRRQRRLDGRDVDRRHRDSRGHGVSISSFELQLQLPASPELSCRILEPGSKLASSKLEAGYNRPTRASASLRRYELALRELPMNRRMRMAGVVVLLAGAAVVTAGQNPPPPPRGRLADLQAPGRLRRGRRRGHRPAGPIRPRPQEGRFPGLRGSQGPDDQRLHPGGHPDRALRAAAVRGPADRARHQDQRPSVRRTHLHRRARRPARPVPALAAGPERDAQVHPGEAGRQRSDGGRFTSAAGRRTRRNSPAANGCCWPRWTSSSARPSGRRPSRRTSGTWRPSASPVADARDPMVQKRGFDARNTLEELQAIADWFGSVRGRKKSILFVSEGIEYDIEDVVQQAGRDDDHGSDARSHPIGHQVERQHLRHRSARADRHGRRRDRIEFRSGRRHDRRTTGRRPAG